MTGAHEPAGPHELAEKARALGELRGAPAADPVNVPMIRHWLAAMGDDNPVYLEEGLAPPAMAQVWTMAGVRGTRDGSPIDEVLAELDAQGFTGVVATDCRQTYHRYARVGDLLTPGTRFTELAGPKRTKLGEGYFVTWTVTWYDAAGEPIADMLFRILKFRPAQRESAQKKSAQGEPAQREPAETKSVYPLKPSVNQDTVFFWDGVKQGELRIQRCEDCGELRHPPGPLCPSCRSTRRGYAVASGEGTVLSYVVHHHPPVPGRTAPFAVAVVELPEGVRIVGNVVDCPVDAVEIGLPLRVTFREMDADLTLPMWAPMRAPREP
jgi:uncharacterized protein